MKKVSILILTLVFTVFTATAQMPRSEYPRPQFERTAWVNLNGTWTYTFDFGKSGNDRKLNESKGFDQNITVPFCPQSKLSGVAHTDFINQMWYHRKIQVPANWADQKIILHFGAVDYESVIFIDGKQVRRHFGGTSSFEVDVTKYVKDAKEHDLVLKVVDDERSGLIMKGKQASNFYSNGCDYTRTTGIWQTVWMEAVAKTGLRDAYIVPDLDQKCFVIHPSYYGVEIGQKLRVNVKDGDKVVSTVTIPASDQSTAVLPLKTVKAWAPGSPFLYNIDYDVLDAQGQVIDHVAAYAGMRKIQIVGNRFYLNNKPIYLRLVLDQGFYPTGIWTAPSDADLKKDIQLSMDAGFNGARLHQKVFEARYHYWADKMGYLTWGESSSWGANFNKVESARNAIAEWREIVERDRNCTSIIAWTPLNEEARDAGGRQYDRFVRDLYETTHAMDYRPVNDASGWAHIVTDIWSRHNYDQNPDVFKKSLGFGDDGLPQQNEYATKYAGQPYIVDEWGGIQWIVGKKNAANSWGYGDDKDKPKTEEEFYTHLKALDDVMLNYDYIGGWCYTQLTDVEQEQNGIYNYDRSPKFDMKRIHDILSRDPENFK